MNGDCLKLTTYSGERSRSGNRLSADALLEIYERHQIDASILLRGTEGFGPRQHLRTDRLLGLSEDLPLVAVAVDRRDRIENLLDEVAGLNQHGLLTLERARLATGELGAVALPEQLNEATKLTIYLGRRERIEGRPAYLAVCELLHERGIAGASAFLGVDGTVRGKRQRARFFSGNDDVPMMLIAIGSGDRVTGVLPALGQLLSRPTITLERAQVLKRDGELIAPPRALPSTDGNGLELWQKLMVYTSEATRHEGKPIHSGLIRGLRGSGFFGATSLRGVWGFHGDHRPHGDRAFRLRRSVPVVTVVIDKPDRIAEAFGIVDELTTEHGLVTGEMVPLAFAFPEAGRSRGFELSRHHY